MNVMRWRYDALKKLLIINVKSFYNVSFDIFEVKFRKYKNIRFKIHFFSYMSSAQ